MFVCTGNICRSPMAEYLLRDILGKSTDWDVSSAGLISSSGLPPSPGAVRAMKERKIDIQKHMNRAISDELVDSSDVIVVMTQSHFDRIAGVYPSARGKCFLLRSFDPAADSIDLEDPLGGSDDIYVLTRKRIEAAMPGLVSFLKELQLDSNPERRNK